MVSDELERPIDLCDSSDFATIGVMLGHQTTNASSSSAADGTQDYEEDGTIHEADERDNP